MKKRIIRLTERELNKIVKRVLSESYEDGIIQQGDDICEIWCKRKLAMYGSNGDVVKMIQHLLYINQYNTKYSGGGMNGDWCYSDWRKCDGKFRKHTRDAVEEFQRKYNLTVDGKVGYDTLRVMCEKLIFSAVLPKTDFCKDCQCQNKDTDKDTDRDTDRDNDRDIDYDFGLDQFDCDEIKYCMKKYLFSLVAPDYPGFMGCIYNNAKKNKGDKSEQDWKNIEMDGFVEGCAWYIKSNALSSGYKYISNCPSQLDCMPGPGKDMRYCNSKKIQACKSKGCTKVTY